MPDTSPPDPARSPRPGRRALQAEQTRRDILDAARGRFAAGGYAATSLKDIAADAGVSVQTVYDSVGSKADLVRRLNDRIDEEADVGELAAGLANETDAGAVARVPARITRRLLERCGDILRACLAGSQAEPDLAVIVDEGGRRHRAGAAAVVARLEVLGALRPGLDAGTAALTVAALADHRLGLVLLDEYGLDHDALEDWIADTTARAVLAPPGSAPARRRSRR